MEIIEPFIEQITASAGYLVERYGTLGIAAAMFAESAGIPFASAVVFLTSGGMIFSGKVSFWSALLASTAGITLGSIFSYTLGLMAALIGRMVRKNIFHRHKQKKGQITKSRVFRLWERYGSFSVFMGQFWGVTRTFISFPAGAMQMNILLFIVYTTLGGCLFSFFAIGASIIFTGALGLVLRHLSLLLSLPLWAWAVLLVLPAGLAVLYRRRGWKLSPVSFWKRSAQWLRRRK